MAKMNLDETDSRIIRALTSNGRASVSELSELVNLSQTPVARRIRNLEKEGVISGYSAIIDERKLGFTFSVFVSVRLEKHIDDRLEVFETTVRSMPEVVDCWLMTGNSDYLLRVVTRDIEEFEKFLLGDLTRIDGVATIESSIPLRRVKSSSARTF